MIARLRGTVVEQGLDRVVVECGGVGYEVLATPATLSHLRLGEEATIATFLAVKEDSMTLYGFEDADEREMFTVVQTVSGIGPRLALTLLATITPDQLRRALLDEDVATLQRVPGIGKKSAQRMVLELQSKIAAPSGGLPTALPALRPNDVAQEVGQALEGLGWKRQVAEDTVAAVLAQPDAPTEVGQVLRAALQSLGGNRG